MKVEIVDVPTTDDIRSLPLTQGERAEIGKLLANDRRIFFPTPGPQFDAYTTTADITGYGGAAGGGKTYLISGLALTEHKRSVIFRQSKNQTRKFIQDFADMLGSSEGYSSQNSEWKLGGKLIEFGGFEDPKDFEKWQGRDHDLKCVGKGTSVWMADGSRRPIETLHPGDMVATLDGPRRVTRTMSVRKQAVRVTSASGSQVQGHTHQLLTAKGWASYDQHRTVFSSPTSHLAAHIFEGASVATFAARQPVRGYQRLVAELRRGCVRYLEGCRWMWAILADMVRISQESAIAVCYVSNPVIGLLVSGPRSRQARRVPALASTGSVASLPALCGDGDGARTGSLLRGSQVSYSSGNDHDDGQPRLFAEDDQPDPHRPTGAGPRSPTCWLVDDPRQTPTHSRREWTWNHPYTKEKRQTAYPRRVEVLDYCDVGVQTLYDLTVEDANHYVTGAGYVNQNCYDEATQMREHDVRYTMGWNRSPDPAQRCRTVLTFNPPTTAEGRWVVRFFGPWLDPLHQNPAIDGELRWFTTVGDNEDFEVAVPDAFVIKPVDGRLTPVYDFDPDDYGEEDIIRPKSRTFITAKVTDNPYYMKTGYVQTLQMLPEPLRSQMLKGDFMAGVEDDEFQLIPTAWVEAAQRRWRDLHGKQDFKTEEMESMGVDAARGGNMGGTTGAVGKDKMVISCRFKHPAARYYSELVALKGVDVNTGNLAAAQIIQHRKHNAPVHLDVASIGTSPFDSLNENNIHVVACNNAAASRGHDKSGILKFSNRRAEYHWRMREALDPETVPPTALPPDPELLADLTAPRYSVKSTGIVVEPKAEIKKRIGRSPDKGEAVMYANIDTIKRDATGMIQGLPAYMQDRLRGSSSSYDENRLRELDR